MRFNNTNYCFLRGYLKVDIWKICCKQITFNSTYTTYGATDLPQLGPSHNAASATAG